MIKQNLTDLSKKGHKPNKISKYQRTHAKIK